MIKTNRRNFISALTLAGASILLPRMSRPDIKRLNFIFFLVDDLGWTDLGCYGSSFYKTPNIDALAETGVRFTNAYAAAPVCSPTRASIMTGKHPARIGITDWIGSHRKGRLIPPKNLDGLPLEEFTLAESFKKAGYQNFFTGKWHLGKNPLCPENQGFEENKGGCHKGHPTWGYFSPYFIPNLENGPFGEYLTDRLTDEALGFLDRVGENSFLLFLSHYAVHVPIQSKPSSFFKYARNALQNPQWKNRKVGRGKERARAVQDHPVYAGMVESVDISLGRVVNKLHDLGLEDKTAIIIFSDNGGLSTSEGSPTSNLPLRVGKGWLYEGGIRVPLIISAPGIMGKGREVSEPVMSTDFYPTMLELAGLPSLPEQHLDGASLAPLLAKNCTLKSRDLFWHYPHYSNQGNTPGAAIRSGDYKYIEYFEDESAELYNLAEDIGEKNNLIEKDVERAREMRRRLHEWFENVGAPMPVPNPDYKGRK